MCHRECSAASNIIQYDQFGGGWSGEEYTWEGQKTCYPMVDLLLSGTGMNFSGQLSDLTLLVWALGSSWCMTNECVGSLWMMMVLMLFTGLHNPQTCIQLKTSGMLHIGAFTATNNTTDCPGAHWCPDPGLAETPPGHHPLSHQEHDAVGSAYRHVGAINTTDLHYELMKFIQVGSAIIFTSSTHWVNDVGFSLTIITSFYSQRITHCIYSKLRFSTWVFCSSRSSMWFPNFFIYIQYIILS